MLRRTAVLAIAAVLISTAGQLALKAGMTDIGFIGSARISEAAFGLLLQIFSNPKVFAGMTLYAISAVAWLIVLSRAPLSFAYPFVGLTYVAITLFSRYVLAEEISPVRWAGIGLVILGIALVGRSAAKSDELSPRQQGDVPIP